MKLGKIENLLTNLHHKTEYVTHNWICYTHKKFEPSIKSWTNFEKSYKRVIKLRVIKFNQKDWLKLYIDMNTDLRQKAKNNLRKIVSSWCIMKFSNNCGKFAKI